MRHWPLTGTIAFALESLYVPLMMASSISCRFLSSSSPSACWNKRKSQMSQGWRMTRKSISHISQNQVMDSHKIVCGVYDNNIMFFTNNKGFYSKTSLRFTTMSLDTKWNLAGYYYLYLTKIQQLAANASKQHKPGLTRSMKYCKEFPIRSLDNHSKIIYEKPSP